MPVADVWRTPSPLNTPLWWRLASGIAMALVAACCKLFIGLLNKPSVTNLRNLYDAIENRPIGKPLITASNHYSFLDDPLLAYMLRWKHIFDRDKFRWIPGATDVCFRSRSASLFFQLVRCLPIVRGEGVYQHTMNFLVDELNSGGWVNIFPEGKVNETKEFMRLKWGIGRLVADSQVCPVVLPYWVVGMDSVIPNTQPQRPQVGKKITVTIGEPMNFECDLKALRNEEKTDMEIRKFITDKIQDEFRKLKAITERRHFGHAQDDTKYLSNGHPQRG